MIVRVQLGFPYDSALPRDVITLNPHFETPNATALAAALKQNILNYTPTADKPATIKVYDALKAPPSYPLATETIGGTPATAGGPREVALCLSYYAGVNRPTFRGRLYLPAWWFGVSYPVRPTTAVCDAALLFADVLTKNLPATTWWSLYSHKNRSAAQVSDLWVDDEWDTVRSRGLKNTTRRTKHIGP